MEREERREKERALTSVAIAQHCARNSTPTGGSLKLVPVWFPLIFKQQQSSTMAESIVLTPEREEIVALLRKHGEEIKDEVGCTIV